MFDYESMDMGSGWMGASGPPKRKSVKKALRKRQTKRYSRPTTNRTSSFNETIEKLRKGYTGSAKKEYLKREKARKTYEEEQKYKQKLKSEYGVKSGPEKAKSFLKSLKRTKSVYGKKSWLRR